MVANNCPKCQHDDMIRKVSAILDQEINKISTNVPVTNVYTDGNGKAHTYRTYEESKTTQVSVLAQRLMPPNKPSAGIDWGKGVKGVSTLGKVIGVFLIVGLISFLCIGVLYSYQVLSNSSEVPQSTLIKAIVLFVIISLVVIAIIGLVWFSSHGLLRRYGHNMSQKHAERKDIVENQEIPQWMHAMQRWDKLYYCDRDGVVFVPGEGTYAPVDRMINYIYR